MVKPSSGTISPKGSEGSKSSLMVEFMSQAHGSFNAMVILDIEGQSPSPSIAVSAQAVQHSLKV